MQIDLFDVSRAHLGQKGPYGKPGFFEKLRISLRFDQLLVVAIVGVILYAIVFSYGVEKGKRVAWAEIQAERTKREDMIREFRARLMNSAEPAKTAEKERRPEEGRRNLPVRQAGTSAEQGFFVAQSDAAPQNDVTKPLEGKFTIQTVTYKTQSAADRQLKKLEELGLKSFIIPSGSYLQVCIEAFESKHLAMNKLRELKTSKMVPQDAYVRAIPH